MTSSITQTTTKFNGQTVSVILPKPLKIAKKSESAPKPTKPVIQAEVVLTAFILFLIGANLLIGSQAINTFQPKTAGAISSGVSEVINEAA